MGGTIQFNRKLFLWAVEIQNEFADAVLASQFATGQLAAF